MQELVLENLRILYLEQHQLMKSIAHDPYVDKLILFF
jgi:tRNA G46 methylase TrmB